MAFNEQNKDNEEGLQEKLVQVNRVGKVVKGGRVFGFTALTVVGDGNERAVEQHHRLTASVNFVVHFEPVDRRVTRRRLLLSRYDSWHEHRQEKSYCLHV